MGHAGADLRMGSGQVALGAITSPTVAIDPRCMCSWTVIRPGPGRACLSAIKYVNALCCVRHVQAVTR
jgi:hypothetical protein